MLDGPSGWVLGLFLFALGATLGSFLNVVIYRLPRAESVVYPPSHCMSCGARLTVLDLFPVLSYLFLRGRCRHCGRGFSPRYALVEAACGALAVAAVFYQGLTLDALAIFTVCLCLIAIFFVDLDHMIIPDEFVAIIAVIGIAFDVRDLIRTAGNNAISFEERIGTWELHMYLPRSIVGMLVGAGLLFFLGWVFERVMGKPSMGGGDVKLAGAMGTLLGPGYLFLSYFVLAIISGAVVGVVLLALRRRGRRDYIPFGPMLAASGIAMLLWGDTLAPLIIQRFIVH
jgi:leader peptidase (prepilin peptidase) / N-methyltransferase